MLRQQTRGTSLIRPRGSAGTARSLIHCSGSGRGDINRTPDLGLVWFTLWFTLRLGPFQLPRFSVWFSLVYLV